jgi:predicted Zn-dependent protease
MFSWFRRKKPAVAIDIAAAATPPAGSAPVVPNVFAAIPEGVSFAAFSLSAEPAPPLVEPPPFREAPPAVELAREEPPPLVLASPPPTVSPRQALERLLVARDFAAAGSLLASLPKADQSTDWGIRAALQLAQDRRDNDAILRLAERLRARAPTDPAGFIAASIVLRQTGQADLAEALVAEGLERRPEAAGLWNEAAQVAVATGQHALAFDRWAGMRARAPNATIGFWAALMHAAKLDDDDRFRALAAEALARFPQDRSLLLACARHSARKSWWEEARVHWEALRRNFPDDAPLALEGIKSFFGKRFDRATRRTYMQEQLERLEQAFPDFAPAFAWHIELLRDGLQLREATALADAVLPRFSTDPGLALAAAGALADSERTADALRILHDVRLHGPPNVELEAAMIRALRKAGDLAAAERTCAAALEAFPGNVALIEQHVTLASAAGDFDEAASRLATWRARYPESRPIRMMANRLNMLSEEETRPQAANATAVLPSQAEEAGGTPRLADASLMARFESLGAPVFGCEFGMVQRTYGADPIGLMRWANMTMQGLIDAVASGFDGIGEPEHTRIEDREATSGEREYCLLDDRFGFFSHTFIRVSEAPRDRVYAQSLRRFRFLRTKLLEDVRLGEKILVFKEPDYASDAPLLALHDAILRHGSSTLLCVVLGNAENPAGSIRMLRPGLFVGHLAMFTHVGMGTQRGVDAAGWRTLCEQVARWQDTAREPAIDPQEGGQTASPTMANA